MEKRSMKKDNEITLPTTSEIEELYKKAKYHKLFYREDKKHGFYVNCSSRLCDFGSYALPSNPQHLWEIHEGDAR